MSEWTAEAEQEYEQFCDEQAAQEMLEREQREAEELLEWWMSFTAAPKQEKRNEMV